MFTCGGGQWLSMKLSDLKTMAFALLATATVAAMPQPADAKWDSQPMWQLMWHRVAQPLASALVTRRVVTKNPWPTLGLGQLYTE